MLAILQTINSFKKEEKGQALTEYGLIIALIAVLLIGALSALSGGLGATFGGITSKLTTP
ncbi:MAG: Flp family type IVb pilin [Peptococcaceae bacterium]|nr:Flp family type IVb pilin [Peptococcaceae bacterium]